MTISEAVKKLESEGYPVKASQDGGYLEDGFINLGNGYYLTQTIGDPNPWNIFEEAQVGTEEDFYMGSFPSLENAILELELYL